MSWRRFANRTSRWQPGQIGQPPAPDGQSFQYTLNTLGRLADIEQFEDIILKSGDGGRITRVKDVARVELGSQSYDVSSELNAKPTVILIVYQSPDSNALDVSAQVRARMAELSQLFPEGVEHTVALDTTEFVAESIHEVVETLFIAVVLVFLTLYVFLQDWRATLIPAVTIPVSLIGTFLVMAALGFSINTLTLFGLLLAIGIVVDDAIIVVRERVATH